MESMTVIGVFLFALTEALVVVALLTPEWIISNFAGETKLGLAVSCRSTPGSELFCNFPLHHPTWRAAVALIILAIFAFAGTIILLVVSLRLGMRGRGRDSVAFRKRGTWFGLLGVIFLCVAGIIFPAGFTMDEIGSKPYRLPDIFTIGYSYIFFNISIVTGIFGEILIQRFYVARTR